MKNVTITRGYAGLQAFIPVIKSRKAKSTNVQEVTTAAPVQLASTPVSLDGRVRLLAKRNVRLSRRLSRQA